MIFLSVAFPPSCRGDHMQLNKKTPMLAMGACHGTYLSTFQIASSQPREGTRASGCSLKPQICEAGGHQCSLSEIFQQFLESSSGFWNLLGVRYGGARVFGFLSFGHHGYWHPTWTADIGNKWS